MPGTPSTTNNSHKLSDECVKVVVRSRPELSSDNRSHSVEKPKQSLTAQFGLPCPDEPGAGASPWYTVDPIDKAVRVDSSIFSYSNVFGPEATQEDVYNATVGEVLDSVLDGFNGAVFAYGVTGSGKTYTMMGNTENKGATVVALERPPRAPCACVPRFPLFFVSGLGISLGSSCNEIYGKKLVDLFNTEARAASMAGSGGTLEICGNSTRIHVRGIKEILVKNESQALEVLQDGCKMLHFRQTECNESSSRSHAVFTINFTSSAGRRSKLVMIDLAGSENVKRSKVNKDGVKEAGEINTSLSVLGRVVEALNNGSSHVPYRESLLTRLLQDSLGGNCKTCMIATINPERRNENEYRQTVNTLQFALRMSKVVNRPRIATIDSTEKRGSLSSTGFNQQELEETMTRTMEEFKTEFKGWRENLENLVGRNNRESLAELEEVKRVHRENMGAKEQHIEDVKVQLEAARTELQRLHAGMLERSQEAERHMEEINEKHRMEMRKLHEELVSVTAAAASNREAAARLEAELVEARSQASRLPELLSGLEAQRAEVRRLSAELESMTGERDDALNEVKTLSEYLAMGRLEASQACEQAPAATGKALPSKTEEVRSVLEEMVDPPSSDALECMRNHYERIVLELRQREAHLCEELSRAREIWNQSQSEVSRQGSTDLLSRLPRVLPSPTRPTGLEQASGGPLDPELMESVDRLEAHISRCGGDYSLSGAEKAIARELKHIYDGASASPEELYPAVYHLLVRVLTLGDQKLSQLALRVLSRLCWNSPVNRARCAVDADRMGLPQLLATLLESSGGSERLAAQATRFTTVIITQAWRDSSEYPELRVPSPYCSTLMLRALLVPLKQHFMNSDIFVHTCFCVYGFVQYHSKGRSLATLDGGDALHTGIRTLRENGVVRVILDGIKEHHPERMSGFAGMQALQAFFSHCNTDEALFDVDGAVVQEVAELVLQVMCANAGHADTYKHCVLLLETLLASVQHSDSCKSVLRDHPHLQRALVAARDALRNRVTTPEMILGKAPVSEYVGENTKMALQRVEADDDNTVYRGLVRLGRFFGVELE
ncbi:hypothetical protein FOZ61_007974 [Perkinsus olseni]|uniref:Kinesin motor domain-containing protein n=1 Tax=Perkinsus olseni TaxID=32597 RepID=A0A7J6L6Q6_PEROL|nr:hypothetical protein FOZ61_007974 [Perkinsus olseni]